MVGAVVKKFSCPIQESAATRLGAVPTVLTAMAKAKTSIPKASFFDRLFSNFIIFKIEGESKIASADAID